MIHDILPVESTSGLIGWHVTLDVCDQFTITTIVFVGCDELPVPGYPTSHQIAHVARTKAVAPRPPKPIKRKRVKGERWTAAHDKCQAIAIRDSLGIDTIVDLLPDAIASLMIEWDSRELARQTARRLTGLQAKDCERIENEYRDYSTVSDFDQHAQELAELHPELNWNACDDNGARLWELLSEIDQKRPTRLGVTTIERAAEFASGRYRGDVVFAEWSDEETFEPDDAPF